MIANIDGGSRGNPGPAGYGVRFTGPDGSVVAELSEAIGVATNNVAEYRGLLAALRYAKEQGYTSLTVRSDSLLLVCQMRGEYKVKNAGLQALHGEARRLVWELGRVRFEHVRREFNAEADRLANEAMDGKKMTMVRSQKGPLTIVRSQKKTSCTGSPSSCFCLLSSVFCLPLTPRVAPPPACRRRNARRQTAKHRGRDRAR